MAFFAEDHHTSFELNKKSVSWKEDLNPNKKKHPRNHFAIIKCAVRMVLLHADSLPLTPEDPSQHKEVLRRTAMVAEERIHNNLGFGNKRVSVHTLMSHNEIKTLEKTLKSPENTPKDLHEFFNSDQVASRSNACPIQSR